MIPKEKALIETHRGLSEEIVKPIHGTDEKQGERGPLLQTSLVEDQLTGYII